MELVEDVTMGIGETMHTVKPIGCWEHHLSRAPVSLLDGEPSRATVGLGVGGWSR